jgi:hypothetical protein
MQRQLKLESSEEATQIVRAAALTPLSVAFLFFKIALWRLMAVKRQHTITVKQLLRSSSQLQEQGRRRRVQEMSQRQRQATAMPQHLETRPQVSR